MQGICARDRSSQELAFFGWIPAEILAPINSICHSETTLETESKQRREFFPSEFQATENFETEKDRKKF